MEEGGSMHSLKRLFIWSGVDIHQWWDDVSRQGVADSHSQAIRDRKVPTPCCIYCLLTRFILHVVFHGPNHTRLLTTSSAHCMTVSVPPITTRMPSPKWASRHPSLPSSLTWRYKLTLPSSLSHVFQLSRKLNAFLIHGLMNKGSDQIRIAREEAWKEVHKEKDVSLKTTLESLQSKFSEELAFTIDLAQEKSAFSWLNVLPIWDHGFGLHNSAFRDALALHYGCLPYEILSQCSCGKRFSVEHTLSCSRGGFPNVRHNVIWNYTAYLITEFCSNVWVVPTLQNLSSEVLSGVLANRQYHPRVHIAVDDIPEDCQWAFLDMKVFNPLAPSYKSLSRTPSYKSLSRNAFYTHQNNEKCCRSPQSPT